jgi:hypothetical protein
VRLVDGERLVVVLAVPGAAHDVEELELGAGQGGALAVELVAQGRVAGPRLAVEDRVHQAGGGDQLVERGALGLRQALEVGAQLGGRELLDLGGDRAGGLLLLHAGLLDAADALLGVVDLDRLAGDQAGIGDAASGQEEEDAGRGARHDVREFTRGQRGPTRAACR